MSEQGAAGTGKPPTSKARERILTAAYELFSRHGIGAVGVDAIVNHAGVAKVSLYRHFQSKEGLALEFLQRREQCWTLDWVLAEVEQRGADPEARLLAVFDLFDEWFQEDEFEGCSFINVLLESEAGGEINRAAAGHLATLRSGMQKHAEEARLADPAEFTAVWHMLMKGSIIAAGEGNQAAARQAKQAAMLLLDSWPRA